MGKGVVGVGVGRGQVVMVPPNIIIKLLQRAVAMDSDGFAQLLLSALSNCCTC